MTIVTMIFATKTKFSCQPGCLIWEAQGAGHNKQRKDQVTPTLFEFVMILNKRRATKALAFVFMIHSKSPPSIFHIPLATLLLHMHYALCPMHYAGQDLFVYWVSGLRLVYLNPIVQWLVGLWSTFCNSWSSHCQMNIPSILCKGCIFGAHRTRGCAREKTRSSRRLLCRPSGHGQTGGVQRGRNRVKTVWDHIPIIFNLRLFFFRISAGRPDCRVCLVCKLQNRNKFSIRNCCTRSRS